MNRLKEALKIINVVKLYKPFDIEIPGAHRLPNMSKQISPCWLILGWKIGVSNINVGGLRGKLTGNRIAITNFPFSNGVNGYKIGLDERAFIYRTNHCGFPKIG